MTIAERHNACDLANKFDQIAEIVGKHGYVWALNNSGQLNLSSADLALTAELLRRFA